MPWKRTSKSRSQLKLVLLCVCFAAAAGAAVCAVAGKVCEISARSPQGRGFFSIPPADMMKRFQELRKP